MSPVGHPCALVVHGSSGCAYNCDVCYSAKSAGSVRLRCGAGHDYDECIDCFKKTASFSKQHCIHCKGLNGACGCKHGCPRTASAHCARTTPSGHSCALVLHGSSIQEFVCDVCQYLKSEGTSHLRCAEHDYDECIDCFKKSKSFSKGHCNHCRGLEGGLCGCTKGCPRPSSAQCERASLGLAVEINRINLFIVADMSGSMAGSRWSSVVRGVRNAQNALMTDDLMSTIVFNDEVQIVGPERAKEFPMSAFAQLRPSGQTHLYDAVAQALGAALRVHMGLGEMYGNRKAKTYVVVMTDGEDTGSASSLADVQEELLKVNMYNNVKVIFAGIQLPQAGRLALLSLAMMGDGDIQFREMEDNTFDSMFEHLCLSLRMR